MKIKNERALQYAERERWSATEKKICIPRNWHTTHSLLLVSVLGCREIATAAWIRKTRALFLFFPGWNFNKRDEIRFFLKKGSLSPSKTYNLQTLFGLSKTWNPSRYIILKNMPWSPPRTSFWTYALWIRLRQPSMLPIYCCFTLVDSKTQFIVVDDVRSLSQYHVRSHLIFFHHHQGDLACCQCLFTFASLHIAVFFHHYYYRQLFSQIFSAFAFCLRNEENVSNHCACNEWKKKYGARRIAIALVFYGNSNTFNTNYNYFFFSSRFSSSSLERWMRVDCRWTNENINKRPKYTVSTIESIKQHFLGKFSFDWVVFNLFICPKDKLVEPFHIYHIPSSNTFFAI